MQQKTMSEFSIALPMIVVGVDEAGRGPLAGSVIASAVIFPENFDHTGITDSKKISPAKRQKLFTVISRKCQWAIGEANAQEIDSINILRATLVAMKRAVENLKTDYHRVLVDGNHCPDLAHCQAIIKGDALIPVIGAASIVAKYWRDQQMLSLHTKYPQYGFDRHKGYGTKQHLNALKTFGAITGVHRFSFKPVRDSRINSALQADH